MRKPPTYNDFEKQFPDYIIIQKSGCFMRLMESRLKLSAVSWNTSCMKTIMAS